MNPVHSNLENSNVSLLKIFETESSAVNIKNHLSPTDLCTLGCVSVFFNKSYQADQEKIERFRYVAEALRENQTIIHIDLHSNNIGAEGAAFLETAIKMNTTITHINLSLNDIGDEGTEALSDSLASNDSIYA